MKTVQAQQLVEEDQGQNPVSAKWSFADLHASSLAWIILGLSVIITIAAWRISYDSVLRGAESRFLFKTHDIRSAIEKRMHEQEAALWGGVGVFNASNSVTRSEWSQYVASLHLDRYLPGLQGYGYSEIVAPEKKDEHVRRIRAEGFPDFDIRPAGKRDVYSSIVYLEPFRDRNLRAFGYDMFSEPTRRAAMERARDTGEAAVSGMVTLVQETESDVQRGFLMYLPVYRRGMPISTVEERRAALQGFVYSPFRIKDLMGGILGKGDSELNFRIYDGGAIKPDSLLYDSMTKTDAPNGSRERTFSTTGSMVIGGRPWSLEFHSQPGFISVSDKHQPMIIAAGGILIDILLFLTISSLTNQRRRALSLANRITGELRSAKDRAELAVKNEVVLRQTTQDSNAKLKLANDGLLKFTSIVAHDLRAPLKRIESFVGILREDYEKDFDAEGRDILGRIERGTNRMRLMLDSLHNYTKYSEVSIIGKTANMSNVIESALETLGQEIGQVTVKKEIEESCRVRGDALLLEHVIQNLISNSIKFRGKKDPLLIISAKARGDDFAEIAVSDNGIGIEPEFTEKVFGMFARLHNEDEYEGTGIGLAVCKKIVVDHGGDIYVDPTWRKGTRIVMTLQCADPSGVAGEETLAA